MVTAAQKTAWRQWRHRAVDRPLWALRGQLSARFLTERELDEWYGRIDAAREGRAYIPEGSPLKYTRRSVV